MRAIIAGTRDLPAAFADQLVYELVYLCWYSIGPITEIVSGQSYAPRELTPTTPGVDAAGERLAARAGIPVTRFPAPWREMGRRAGPHRNRLMAEYTAPGGVLLAVRKGKSPGTTNMIANARILNLRQMTRDIG